MKAAKAREVGDAFDQLVRLTPDKGPFPDRFMMGAREDEQTTAFYPAGREVKMAGPIAMGRYSVTFAEWRGFRLTFDLPAAPMHGQNNLLEAGVLRWPALEVSWRDANRYCGWLSRISGERWRLPREAEWEYACRAGTKTAYAWGDEEPTPELANYQGAFGRPINVEGDGDDQRGAFCNDWGLWQMHGNAMEWQQDGWNEDITTLPTAAHELPRLSDKSRAVLRGGSWSDFPRYLRSAVRGRERRDYRDIDIGFRVSRTLVE